MAPRMLWKCCPGSYTQAVVHLTEEISVSDKLPLDHSFVVREFNINAPKMLYIQKKHEEVYASVYEAVPQVLR